MARTRIRQLTAVRNTATYNDQLNQALAEGQSGDTVGTANSAVVSVNSGTNQIVVSGNFVSAGVNSLDRITITGGTNDSVVAIINSASFGGGQTTFTVTTISTSPSLTTDGSPSSTATVTVDPTKSLEKDLNHIRTELRELNQLPHWYSDPLTPVNMYSSSVIPAVSTGNPIDVGGNYNAGSPYDLNVYLNGDLLQPSVVSGGVVTTQYDYQELDSSSNLVQTGQVGREIAINFDLNSGDILQFIWNL